MPVASSSDTPFMSVVIRSKDEAERLKLTLASLECQTEDCEIIVVDDGSSDRTGGILAQASERLPLRVHRHSTARGRSAAANAGAGLARGEVLLFLDGDTLLGPGALSRHIALHRRLPRVIGRGNPNHLRCTRIFLDPETGLPWPDRTEDVLRRPRAEIERMLVTRDEVRHDFGAIERRAEPGIYPGAGPRRLHELEAEALRTMSDCPTLWIAACGHNMSIPREEFLAVGGFDTQLDINEHRELALKLFERGFKMIPVPDAPSYHLTHRSGWRDPLKDGAWEAAFLERHPRPEAALMIVFWASLSHGSPIPPQFRIGSLAELAEAARSGRDYDDARESIMAPRLGSAFWAAGAEGGRSAAASR